VVFESNEWVQLDEGLITHQEALEIFRTREPDYASEIQLTMERLTEMLTPISETIALLPKIKASGHKLYYLSNFHTDLKKYIFDEYDFFNLFDGGIFSCDVNACKPSPLIYHRLLDKYSLIPEECVFFDDMEENAVAAQKEGLNGIVFTDAECVRRYFDNM